MTSPTPRASGPTSRAAPTTTPPSDPDRDAEPSLIRPLRDAALVRETGVASFTWVAFARWIVRPRNGPALCTSCPPREGAMHTTYTCFAAAFGFVVLAGCATPRVVAPDAVPA